MEQYRYLVVMLGQAVKTDCSVAQAFGGRSEELAERPGKQRDVHQVHQGE